MNDVNTLLALLDDRAACGLDLSPGDDISKQAAERIRYLSAELNNVSCVVDRLQRDKIILREALVRLVGVSTPTELEQMKKAIGAMITLGVDSNDVQAALAGINALLDTV